MNWTELTEEKKLKLFKEGYVDSTIKWSKLLSDKHRISVNYETLKSFARRHREILEVDSLKQKISDKYTQQERKNELSIKARNEEFLSRLKNIVPGIDNLYPQDIVKPSFDKTKDSEDVVILISDPHVGAKISPEQSGGLAYYNKDMFEEKLNRFKKAVLRLLGIIQGYASIENIWLVYLGDIVEGHDIFKGQSYSLDLNVAEASYLAAKKFAEFEMLLFKHSPAKKIITVEIPGNHGIPGGRKAGDVPLTLNFDWISYRIKDLIVKNSLGFLKLPFHKKIIHNISNTWFELFEVQGFKFLATHGDEIRKYMSIPAYSMIKTDAKYLRLLEQHFDYWVTAHHHSPCSLPAGGGEIIMNGSFPGASIFSLRQLTEGQPASQWMFSVHPRKGISARWKILLEEKVKSNIVKVITCDDR